MIRFRMIKLLLDTNIVIWAIFKTNLSDEHLALLSQAGEVFVSPLSILEIRIKQELGKLPLFDISHNIELMDMAILPFSSSQAESYSLHSMPNKDPFDNALVSIALMENLTLMTSDKKILEIKNKALKTLDARN